MSSALALLRRHPVVRASALAILFYGFAGAATTPYQSVVGIRTLGLSDRGYSALVLAAAVMNVLASIGIGILADRMHSFRRPMIVVSCLGVAGFAAIWLAPGPWVFVLAVVGPIAFYNVMNSLLFANVRAHGHAMTPAEAVEATTVMRMTISVSWVLVPGIVGAVLSWAGSALEAYLMAGLFALGGLVTVKLMPRRRPGPPSADELAQAALPPEGELLAPPQAPPPVAAMPRPALGELALLLAPGLLARLLGVALVSAVLHVNAAILPLIVTGRGGRLEDVGIIMGMVAFIEVIFMLAWTRACRRISVCAALAAGMVLYGSYLLWLALAQSTWEIYVASAIGGIGAAGLVSLPIGYLLDLIEDRPGLSASLIAVNMFVAGGIGAGLFALGSALGGYGAAAVLAALAGAGGALLLLALEGWRLRAGQLA